MGKSLLGALVLATFRNGHDFLVTRPGVVVTDWGTCCNLQVDTDGANDFPNGQTGHDGKLWLTSQREAEHGAEAKEGEFVLRVGSGTQGVADPDLADRVKLYQDTTVRQSEALLALSSRIAALEAQLAHPPVEASAAEPAPVDPKPAA